ncbi:MAG: MBL fold metallo-hydrolase [Planctomycetota bacterium]|nr:MBL fold metallo-hydrolase [Planctomycetota bacterium]MDE1889008.1 MBL fold metallo-hydrolase [Planctomycetota bacterium]MDE2216979.1 MBL fold metallo-hydrolase [Planctomycetota bacterium]
MKFGKFEIYPVTDGYIYLDGGAVFGVVPRILWEKIYAPDEKNRIRLSLCCPLIVTKKYNILIDTGVGTKHNEKFCQIYGIDKKSNLLESLYRFGYQPKNIDLVVNTHLHFDHAGGNTTFNEKGEIVPTFPKAKYFIQKGEMEVAVNPNERTKASYITEDFLPLSGPEYLNLVNDETIEVDKGVSLVRIGGHTRHHQCVKIESEGQVAFFLADLAPTVAHLHYPYITGYDLFPLETLENKKKILKQAFEERWLLIFQHDPKVRMGYLKKRDERFGIEEIKVY